MQALHGGHVAQLTWPEIAAILDRGSTALLPVGAACKEHGLHLPMATDWLQAEWLAARAAEQREVLVWPTLGYGHYPAFVDYAGSISVRAATFTATVTDILDGIDSAGAVRCVVLNTGISTIAPLREALAAGGVAGSGCRLLHNVSEGPRYRECRRRLETQRRGGHADEMETSVMLALAPAQVRMDRAAPADQVEYGPGPLHPTPAAGRNHSPSGAYGDPTRADSGKGRLLLEAMLDDLLASIDAGPSSAAGADV